MEKIIRIDQNDFTHDRSNYEGFNVVTDKQTINVGISVGQSCCEQFGCVQANDDLKEFEGADLISIEIVDTELNKKVLEDIDFGSETSTMFVNFNTSKGVLQLVAYNTHNGYYGHDAVLVSTQLTTSESL